MVSKKLTGLFLLFSAGSAMLTAAVVEERFQNTRDFSPALERWMYRGVAGEVIGGAYLFTGVNQRSSEYWDVNPEDAQMLLRYFPAGNAVAISGRFTAMPHPYKVFEPGKGVDQKAGLLIQSRAFERKKALPADQPYLSAYLKKSRDGKRSFELDYVGNPAIPLQASVEKNGSWNDGEEYVLELVLKGDSAVGTVRTGKGELIWKKTLRSPEFKNVFRTAYPGFRNYRMTGKLAYFKADNLNSAPDKNSKELQTLAFPEVWKTSDGRTVRFRPGEMVDFARLFAGRSGEKVVTLRASGSVPREGLYLLKGDADWFWKLTCNGKVAADFMKIGGRKGGRLVTLELQKGAYTLELTVKAGSVGWNFAFLKPTEEEIRQQILLRHTYGSDVLVWNLDRLLDDLRNLRRYAIAFPDLEREITSLRSTLPADLGAAEIRKYDSFLNRAYGRVYDAYRYIELLNSIGELRAFLPAGTDFSGLEQCAAELKRRVLAGKGVEELARKAENLLASARKSMNGFAEGVSKGGSFGRFGWVTSSTLSDYTSGDGLLANQVLSDGAIARQYVFSPANPKLYWQIRFRFEGERDAAVEKRLKALPVTGPNLSVQFGYDPTQFYSGSTPSAVKVNAISWTRKQFTYADAFTADMNLLSPALLLESAHREFLLYDSPTGSFTNIGYLAADGSVFSGPVRDGVLYDRARDGALGSNWIMLWDGKNSEQDLTGHRGSIPLQVIFQHHPRTIVRNDNEIRITFDRGGALWLNTLCGAELQATGNWRGNLPFTLAKRADFAAQSALAQPVDFREFYRYDAKKNTVEIRNICRFREFGENDWKRVPRKMLFLPPVLSLMADRGFDAVLPKNLRNLNYPTIYGPLYGVEGSEITYTLPVPDVPQYSIARNTEGNAADVACLRQHAMDNVEGAKFRLFDERICRAWQTVNLPGCEVSKVWHYYPAEYQAYLKGLFRYLMEISSGYRANRFWRSLVEPYSGKKYFYSFSIGAEYPGDVGVFGDRGYGVGLHLLQLDLWSSLTGDNDRLKSVWRDNAPLASPDAVRDGRFLTVDKMLGYVKNVHDWAWMDDGSNDSGDNGPVVDCSQAPFAGHSAYLRLARRVGNAQEIAKGAYHLAKSQLPLIARPAFLDYGREIGVVGVDHVNVGFREFITPNSFSNQNMLVTNERNAYVASYASLIAYAGRDDGLDIFFPYAKYIWNDLRRFRDLASRYFPNGNTDSYQFSAPLESTLLFRILDGESLSKLRRISDNMRSKTIFYIRNSFDKNALPLLLTGGCPLLLTEWTPLPLPDFAFVPSEKKAVLTFESVPADYRLGALSSRKPVTVKANGADCVWSYDPKSHQLRISVPQGKRTRLEILFDRIDPDRFTPYPLPDGKPTLPGVVTEEESLNCRRTSASAVRNTSVRRNENPGTLIYRASFAGEPGKGSRFGFFDWSSGKVNPVRGGITGAYPGTGKAAQALEVFASKDNFSGFGTGLKPIPAGTKKLVVTGRVLRSADYTGNTPMLFFWFEKKGQKGGKPFFYRVPQGKNGVWQEFRFECSGKNFPADKDGFILNMTSQILSKGVKTGGSIFYKDIKIYAGK